MMESLDLPDLAMWPKPFELCKQGQFRQLFELYDTLESNKLLVRGYHPSDYLLEDDISEMIYSEKNDQLARKSNYLNHDNILADLLQEDKISEILSTHSPDDHMSDDNDIFAEPLLEDEICKILPTHKSHDYHMSDDKVYDISAESLQDDEISGIFFNQFIANDLSDHHLTDNISKDIKDTILSEFTSYNLKAMHYQAIHYAAAHGDISAMHVLVERYNCSPYSRASGTDDFYMYMTTPLVIACYYGHYDVVRYLVEELHCYENAEFLHLMLVHFIE